MLRAIDVIQAAAGAIQARGVRQGLRLFARVGDFVAADLPEAQVSLLRYILVDQLLRLSSVVPADAVQATIAGTRVLQRAGGESLGQAFSDVVERLLCSVPKTSPDPDPVDRRVGVALEFIAVHGTTRAVRLREVAAFVRLSSSRLARLVKKATGESVGVHTRRVRLQAAQHLLLTTTFSVKEVAWKTGYLHVGEFVRDFRQRAGLPPGAWRRLNGEAAP